MDIDERPLEVLRANVQELLQFVTALEMGEFYAGRLRDLLGEPSHARVWSLDTPSQVHADFERRLTAEYREQLKHNSAATLGLIVEMLRYQNWPDKTRSANY